MYRCFPFSLMLLWLLCAQAAAAAACGEPGASIHELKGYSGEPADPGTAVEVEGVISGAFHGGDALKGFYLQQTARPDGDGLPAGLFVYAPALDRAARDRAAAGHHVRVKARVSEFRGQLQLSRVSRINLCGEPGLPEAQPLSLPPEDADTLARMEGLKVVLPQTLTVTGNDQLVRYGTLDLAADGRLFRPTNFVDHDSARNHGRRLILDDGSYRSFPESVPYLDEHGTRRTGSTLDGLTGVLAWAFDDYRLHPTRPPQFVDANPRPSPPEAVSDGIRVAAFNVQNYFITLGRRGAATRAELQRQRERLVAALHAVDADVVGLMEMENDPAAVADLLEHLNDGRPVDRHYRHLRGPASTGTDEIKVSLVYRPARVRSLGPLLRDGAEPHLRPPAVARLAPVDGGEDAAFAVATVHFKSKTRCPSQGDVDRGQGCWNQLRVAQAAALLEFMQQLEEPGLVIGDINAYGAEDPVRVFTDHGFSDLLADHVPRAQRYTYVFRGESGYLDYLLAASPLAGEDVAPGIWHVNADEPRFLGYDGRYPSAADGTPYRSSDHDPLWVDLPLSLFLP